MEEHSELDLDEQDRGFNRRASTRPGKTHGSNPMLLSMLDALACRSRGVPVNGQSGAV